MNKIRKETGSPGEVSVPADKLWGAQTQESLEHFSACTAAFIAISVLEKCFAGELTASAWLPKLKQIIPSYGVSLIENADFCRQIRAATAGVLKVDNIPQPAARAPAVAKQA